MPGALVLDRAVVLHVPKTGGTWLAEALRAQHLVRATLTGPRGTDHPTLEVVRHVLPRPPIITCVREPVSWLSSFYRFSARRGWKGSSTGAIWWVDHFLRFQAPTFQAFVETYLRESPGAISWMFETYGAFEPGAQVCRQERLGDDVIQAGRVYRQPVDPHLLLDTPRVNVSPSPTCSSDLPDDLAAAVRAVDTRLRQWYPEIVP